MAPGPKDGKPGTNPTAHSPLWAARAASRNPPPSKFGRVLCAHVPTPLCACACSLCCSQDPRWRCDQGCEGSAHSTDSGGEERRAECAAAAAADPERGDERPRNCETTTELRAHTRTRRAQRPVNIDAIRATNAVCACHRGRALPPLRRPLAGRRSSARVFLRVYSFFRSVVCGCFFFSRSSRPSAPSATRSKRTAATSRVPIYSA